MLSCQMKTTGFILLALAFCLNGVSCSPRAARSMIEGRGTEDRNGDGVPDYSKEIHVMENETHIVIQKYDHDYDSKLDLVFGKLVDGHSNTLCAWTIDERRGTTARSFYSNGQELISEGDSNGDGSLDQIVFLNTNKMPIAVVQVSPDGVIYPVEKTRFEAVQKEYSIGRDRTQKALELLSKISLGVDRTD